MKNVLLFGTTVFSKEVYYYLKANPSEWNVVGFTVNKEYIKEDSFCGLKVYPFEDLDSLVDMKDTGILPTLGYKGMNAGRRKLFDILDNKGYRIDSYIDDTVFNRSAHIGRGCIILKGVFLGQDCVLGDGNILQHDSSISHDVKMGDFNYISGKTLIAGDNIIGSNNFFGIMSIVNNDLEIGDSNLIGAGSVIAVKLGSYFLTSGNATRIVESDERHIGFFLK